MVRVWCLRVACCERVVWCVRVVVLVMVVVVVEVVNSTSRKRGQDPERERE